MRDNPVKAKLQRGETAIGTMLFELFVPGIPRLMAHSGAELAIYDMEHTGTSFETLRMLAAASRGPSPVPMCRVPATEYHFMARALDVGIPGQFTSQTFQDAMSRVAEVADKHGKPCGVAAGSVEMAEEWMSRGYRAIAYGSDFRLFADGLTRGIDAVRKLVRRT
jgi:2-keto-3-deoxy-L-rhamnonate aldolase RhmA